MGFLSYEFGELIHGEAYFRNFTVLFHKELYRKIYHKRSNHFSLSNHFFYSHNLSLDYRLILVRKKIDVGTFWDLRVRFFKFFGFPVATNFTAIKSIS